mmetsp:Transcript_3683/g.5442  ORF Transcript_3683/g.5442 Transcript_3683/m.5442 type:complete len:264 (-) Transcript_3683:183-974(-)
MDTSIRKTTNQWKRSEFKALLAVRLGSILVLLPVSLILLAISLVGWTLTLTIHLLTFGFTGRHVLHLTWVLTRISLSLLWASITGFLIPVFAVFGLVAFLSVALFELAEPILKIRYQRQLHKIRHLYKLMTDPILLETLDPMLRFAQDVSTHMTTSTTTTSKRLMQKGKQMAVGPQQFVDSLLTSSAVTDVQTKFKNRVSPSVYQWSKDQYVSLRKSGALEKVASQALEALRKDMDRAAGFLPYLEAIQQVRQTQQEAAQKKK